MKKTNGKGCLTITSPKMKKDKQFLKPLEKEVFFY